MKTCENEVRNMVVSSAGYFYIGHYRVGELKIILVGGGLGVGVTPELKDTFSLYDLFKVFDVDPEDGKYLQEIEGKYCRAIFDEDGKVTALQHLIKDDVIWYADGEKDDA